MPLRQLYPDPENTAKDEAAVDIVAVHGLNLRSKPDQEHAWDTWRTPAGPEGKLWLRDELPKELPQARIFLYEYNSTAVYGKDRTTFIDKVNAFLEAMRIDRRKAPRRPLLLLGHSLGGLLIKQALINAHGNEKYQDIKLATQGLAFFATPHDGGRQSLVKIGQIAAKIALNLGFQKGDNILETLKEGSIFSDLMHEYWKQLLLEYPIVSFWGTLDTIVPRESTSFGLPGTYENVVSLQASHGGVCKFGTSLQDRDNFKLVQANIQDLYENAIANSELVAVPEGDPVDEVLEKGLTGLKAHTPSHLAALSDSGYGSVSNSAKSSHILSIGRETQALSKATLGALEEEQENEAGMDDTSDAMDDCNTVYTDNLSLSDVRLESYMVALVDDLSQKIGNSLQSPEVVEEIAAALPRALKAFSCKLGYTGSSQMHRDAMVFIHKYREAMAEMFRERFADAVDSQQNPQPPHRDRYPPEMLDGWFASSVGSNYENPPEETCETPLTNDFEKSLENELEEDHELSVPGIEEYKHMIYTAPSYQWVLGQLRREVLLSKPNKFNTMDGIRERILAAVPGKRHVSSKTASQAVHMTYTVDWDLLAFLRGQEYDESADVAIAGAVTLTGSQADAQASSCQQYLDQTWPCTGSQTLMLIQKMLRNQDYDAQVFVSEPSACSLAASFDGGKLTISASGIPEFVAEIGEQVAWMGSALQLSPYANKVVTECTPFIDDVRPIKGVLNCRIRFDFQPCQEQFGTVNGQCWHNMFRNAVIVRGFPILRRPETNTGLEMPLNLMTSLTGTRHVEEFDSKTYIKGFSTMLVPTKLSDGMIYWHLLFNINPTERISYLDCRTEHVRVQKADLETSRHVLGWCSDAVSTAGTSMAKYSISRSQLPKAHSSCALEGIEIHAGQLVTGTACISLGNREKPVHISRDGYFTKLQWISSKWIVFWEEGEKRGWLVNGASALLHILRASLTHSKLKFKSAFLANLEDILDPENAMGADAALQLLTEEKNRSIPLYPDIAEYENSSTDLGKGKEPETRYRYYRLENRVEHIYNILDKLIEHQTNAEQRSGLRLHTRPRRHLEGWDFKDLAADGDPFFARVATLNALGKGWVDFIRSIHAVVLLGRGFGELIQPQWTSNRGCTRWLTLPTKRYYLAARVSDLKEIMEDHGDAQANPMKLCDDVLWPVKHAAFQSCPCGATKLSLKHYEPVQALFPMKFERLLGKNPLVELQDAGAVVFGHNINIHWHWKDFGDPVKGDPPVEGSSTASFEDSGLGSNLNSCESPSGYDTAHTPSSTSHALSTGASDPSGSRIHGDQQMLTPAGPSGSGRGSVQGVISSIRGKVKLSRWRKTKKDEEHQS